MNTKINISDKIFLPTVVLLTVGFIVLDQAIKKIAVSYLSGAPVYFNDFFSLEIFKNYGIAFGLPLNAEVFYIVVLLFFAWLVSGKLLNFREMGRREITAIGLILSGALGNLIDRVNLGYIIDFVNIGNIVIFNLADVFILAGVIVLLEKFLPDTGKGKMKKNIYILLFMVFGALLSFLVHVFIEVWFIKLLVIDFSKYGLGLNWSQGYLVHSISMVVLFTGGLFFGYVQGKRWWKALYENK